MTLLIACPSVPGTDADGGTQSDAGTSGDGGTWSDGGLEPQPASCEALGLVDVSTPTTVVGDGTAESCTAAALQAAATRGGVIVVNCGEFPVTITVSSPITFTKAAVLDGGGRITLSGGGTSRILLLDSAYDVTGPLLVVQRLTFRDGRSAGGGKDTAVGGGAIYRDGGSLKVIGCTFIGNRAPSPGQDIAGGAIYMDGAGEVTTLCGVRMTGNEAGAIGGGFFRVSNHNNGTFTMDRSTVDANRVTATDSGNAGGMYLQGLTLRMTNSTVSRNKAFYNGGLWLHTSDVQLTNVTVAENIAFGSNGGGLWLSNLRGGTLLNCTIANNRSTARDQIAGAIFGGGLTLQNTLIAGNTAMWVPGCNETHAGQGNLEWPGGAECTASPLVADPLLGGLGHHGGDTETLVPGVTSPARGLGTGCPSTDQRGQPRAERCRRKVLAYVRAPAGVRSILEHLGLPTQALKRAPARGPPQRAWC